MAGVEMIRYSLRWNNPREPRPDGAPEVVLEEIVPRGVRAERVLAGHVLGGSYGIHFQPVTLDERPRRELSLESKQGIRRKSLARRIEREAPLFASTLIGETLASNPEYFGDKKL